MGLEADPAAAVEPRGTAAPPASLTATSPKTLPESEVELGCSWLLILRNCGETIGLCFQLLCFGVICCVAIDYQDVISC